MTRDTGERRNITEHCPPALRYGGKRIHWYLFIIVSWVISLFTKRLEKNYCSYSRTQIYSEWFSIFVFIFEVNIVAEEKQAQLITIFFAFYKFPLRSTLLLHPMLYRFSGVPANDITTNVVVDISSQFRLGCLQFAMVTILDYTSVQQKL